VSYTYLQEQGEESSAECFSDIPAFVLSRSSLIADKSSCNGNETALCQGSQSGMTCEHSTESRGEDSLTLCVAGSLVRTSAKAEVEPELTDPKVDFGNKWHESFAKLDPQSCSWKIRQLFLFEGLEQSLEIWPKWGLMQSGECWELPMPSGLREYRLTIMSVLESSSRPPTPLVSGNYNRKGASKTSGDGLATALRKLGRLPTPTASDNKVMKAPEKFKRTKTGMLRHLNPHGEESQCRLQQVITVTDGGPMNPEWVEWLMGWPIGMTALQPLETDKFQQWLSSHGKH